MSVIRKRLFRLESHSQLGKGSAFCPQGTLGGVWRWTRGWWVGACCCLVGTGMVLQAFSSSQGVSAADPGPGASVLPKVRVCDNQQQGRKPDVLHVSLDKPFHDALVYTETLVIRMGIFW